MTAHKFWDKVERGDPADCWPWTGYVGPSGHGKTTYQCLQMLASRKAWILTHGPIRDDLCVNHKNIETCPLQAICCNPHHLYLGTRIDNMVDRWTGTDAAQRGGVGRPSVLSNEQLAELWRMRREERTLKECAAHFGVSVATVCRQISALRKRKSARLREVRMSLVRDSLV